MTHVFDLHDTAYYIWRDSGVRGARVVHVDAHHDIEHAEPDGAIHIGNFLRAALTGGLIADVFWVVPDPMWADADSRRWMLKDLAHHGADTPRQRDDDALTTGIEGVPVWIGPLDALPIQRAPVLLDVDVDYMLTAARHEGAESPLADPWCRPEALLQRLRARGVRAEIFTIATSVTGGFTPWRWQHLACELAAGAGESGVLAAGAAEQSHQAELLQEHHPFRTRGFWFLKKHRLRDAAEAFTSGLAVEPSDPFAQLGLASVALRRGNPAEAARLAAISLGAIETLDGWRTLATAAARLGDSDRALHAYAKAMRRSLRGEISVTGRWAANPDRRLADPDHWRDHVAVADLHAQAGDIDAAIAHYRIAAAMAPEKPWIGLRLASAHARRRG